MVLGTSHESSGSPWQAAMTREKQPVAVTACVAPPAQKSGKGKSISSLLEECVAGEMAQPEVGVSSAERQVWGEIFQSRQNFIDLHCG